MRTKLTLFIAVLITFFTITPKDVNAQAISIMINGQKESYDQNPVIENGRTMVPLRGIFESLGANVEWNDKEKKVTAKKESQTIELVIGSKHAKVNNINYILDVEAKIVNGRTMVPLRFVSESFGAEVGWIQDKREVTITTNKAVGPTKENQLEIHHLNVGQGDSTLFLTPNGKTILVDVGTQSAGQKIVSYLKKAGITSIDRLVITHAHADHVGGAIQVMQNFQIGQVVDSGIPHTSQTYIDYLTYIDDQDINFHVPEVGEKIEIDPSLNITVVNAGREGDGLNDSSIALYLKYNGFAYLTTGDAEVHAERRMVDKYNLKSDVLKAGHHGSSTSSNDFFLANVKPSAVILSYGQGNSYGHPHTEMLARLANAGVKDVHTSQGDIIVKTNGVGYTVEGVPATNPPAQSQQPNNVIQQSDGNKEPDADQSVKVNINTAGLEQLQEIIGVGPVIAQRIIDYRNVNGEFKSPEDLKRVKGIGDVTFERMRPQITL